MDVTHSDVTTVFPVGLGFLFEINTFIPYTLPQIQLPVYEFGPVQVYCVIRHHM